MAQGSYISTSIKLVRLGVSRRCGRKPDLSLVVLRLKPKSAAAAYEDCSRFPLKQTFRFQPQTTQEDFQPLSLKALFRPTQKVLPSTSWDGTMQQTPLLAYHSNMTFKDYFRKSNILWDGTSSYLLAPATTSQQRQLPLLHRRPPHCSGNYHSCTSSHFPAEAATSSAPAATSPAPAATFLHQQIPAVTSSAPATTSLEPVTTFLHQQTPATISPEPVTAFLHQQTPAATFLHQQTPADTFLHQQIPAAISSAPATTSPGPVTTFLHQQTPATTSSGPANTFLYQQIPILNQRPTIQRIPVLYQLSRPAPATRSCSNDHHPVAAIVSPYAFSIYDSP